METYKCAQCHTVEEKAGFGPFCGERCEDLLNTYAATKTVSKIYEDYKNRVKAEEVKEEDPNVVECTMCYKALDYNFVDERIEYFCNETCVNIFVNSQDFVPSGIIMQNLIFNATGPDMRLSWQK